MTDLAIDSVLDKLLNQFSVPMFAMDKSIPDDAFHFISINSAMETAGDRPATEILGRSVHDLLPKLEADIAHSRYSQCVEGRSDLRFRDQFTTAGKRVAWDTTLQHVALKDGGDRVVGTCIQLSEDIGPSAKDPALDDIQYFSSMADLQLRNLISTFEIFRDRELFSIQNEQHIDKLAGMCRTVQRAVEDIKKVVRSTDDILTPIMSPVCQSQSKAEPHISGRAGSDTIEALFSDVAEDLRRF